MIQPCNTCSKTTFRFFTYRFRKPNMAASPEITRTINLDGQGGQYQDERYGKGVRVHTPMRNGNQRCTVCATEVVVKKAA